MVVTSLILGYVHGSLGRWASRLPALLTALSA